MPVRPRNAAEDQLRVNLYPILAKIGDGWIVSGLSVAASLWRNADITIIFYPIQTIKATHKWWHTVTGTAQPALPGEALYQTGCPLPEPAVHD